MTFGLILAALFAAICVGLLWRSARETARREARDLLSAASASAVLYDELAAIVGEGVDLLGRASISSGPAEVIALSAYQLHARSVAIEASVAAQAADECEFLAGAGVDLGPILQVLGQANAAMHALCVVTSRTHEARAPELVHASARYAAAMFSELAYVVKSLQADIRRCKVTLERLTA
jgi:hypothetical protein